MRKPQSRKNNSERVETAVIIPTYGRGNQVLQVLERVLACEPAPAEILVHIDQGDDKLRDSILSKFDNVEVHQSTHRCGPGGGRHRLLAACKAPFAVSLDDDSWPLDSDFFSRVQSGFQEYPEAAVLDAHVAHPGEPQFASNPTPRPSKSFIGCGHAIRVDAYREIRGYLPLPVAYGMEEADIALQLLHTHWKIYSYPALRVFHNTLWKHHKNPETVAGVISNIALKGFLHYPFLYLPIALIQMLRQVVYCLRSNRYRGVTPGVLRAFTHCVRHRHLRNPLAPPVFRTWLWDR